MHLETLSFLDEFYNSIYKINNTASIKISKDVDFNFGIKEKGKYSRYKKILMDKNASQYIEQLDKCKEMTHTIYNFSLFPQTGAMNDAKEWGEDRVDTFLYYLNELIKEIRKRKCEEVYKEFKNIKSNHQEVPDKYRLLNSFPGRTSWENKLKIKEALIQYLSQYNDIYSYCKDWYLLYDETKEYDTKKFIDEIILNEKSINIIKEPEDVIRYMDIANYFWTLRKKHYIAAGMSEKQLIDVNERISSYDRED